MTKTVQRAYGLCNEGRSSRGMEERFTSESMQEGNGEEIIGHSATSIENHLVCLMTRDCG